MMSRFAGPAHRIDAVGFITHNHLEEPSRGVVLTNSRNRHGSRLLATNDR